MKSLNSQGQWTGKFALKFFLALLLNNFLFISESFLPNKIAKWQYAIAQSTFPPTEDGDTEKIPYPYPHKLFPNQKSDTDCAVTKDTEFPYNKKSEDRILETLEWSILEKEAWFNICEGKTFDPFERKVIDWIDEYNELNEKNDSQCENLNLEQNLKDEDVKFVEIDKISDKISKLEASLDCLKNKKNDEDKQTLEFDILENQLDFVMGINDLVNKYRTFAKKEEINGHKCDFDSKIDTILKLKEPLNCLRKYNNEQKSNEQIEKNIKKIETDLDNFLDKIRIPNNSELK